MFEFTSLITATAIALTSFATPAPRQSIQDMNDQLQPLGRAVDRQSGRQVEGYRIIHFRDPQAKGPKSAPSLTPTQSSICYGFLAKGSKWKEVEPWLINPTNNHALDQANIANAFTSAITNWEDAADGTLGNGISRDILGEATVTSAPLTADSVAPDGQNEVYFGDLSNPGAIAVTNIWGIFSGPVATRQLVEWDQLYDQVDYDWSLTGEATKMDVANVATHELGHAMGLADLYKSSCNQQTMFGYADLGETKKISLEIGDITGLKTLYK